MGNLQSGNPAGNFFANWLNYTESLTEGGLAVLSAPLDYAQGKKPNWTAIGDDYKNAGLSVKNMFTDSHDYIKPPGSSLSPTAQRAQNQAKVLQGVASTSNPLNSRNFGNFASSVASQVNGPSFGSNLGAPPSSTFAISNPNTKMALASSRGDARRSLQTKMKMSDTGAQSSKNTSFLAKNSAGGTATPATSTELSTGDPSQSVASSAPTSSTGGTGNPFQDMANIN